MPEKKKGFMAMTPEMEVYRSLIEQPTEFKEGFTWVAVAGAFFCGLLMMPSAIYLSLVTGGGLPAAWVTLIIFSEVTRRAMKSLSKQELIILLGTASAMASGGPIGQMVWRAFFVQSDAVRDVGLLGKFPSWFAPQPGSAALLQRNLFHHDWLIPISLVMFTAIMGQVASFSLGYFFFRLTSDVEKLPFPFAGVSAQGAMALSESGERKTTWKWRVFSLGAVMGLGFGILQVGVPLVTGALLAKPITLIPLPWYDTTTLTERLLPATPTGLIIDLGLLITGMVIPFWAMVGSGAAVLLTLVLNPILHHFGVLTRWQPGMDTIATTYNNNVDFWMSFGLGVAFGIAAISLYQTLKDLFLKTRTLREQRTARASAGLRRENIWDTPPGRGDFSLKIAIGLYLVVAALVITVCHQLVPKFPLMFLIFFTVIYTPFISYVNARLTGLVGQQVDIPFLLESAILLSGYKGVEIWLAPIPVANYGGNTQGWRVNELTGTRFWSFLKSGALTLPLGFVLSFIFWAFIWHSSAIPSAAFPFVQKMWDLQARNTVLIYTATMDTEGAKPLFFQALHWKVIAGSFSFTMIAFVLLSAFSLPIMTIYGFVGGVGGMPHGFVFLLIGALVGKFYFHKKFGQKRFLEIITVVMAGYGTGVGLIALIGVAINLIVNAVSASPF